MATPLSSGQAVAVRRWKLGHHTFHVLLIAMNSLLTCAADHLERENWPALASTLDRLTVLYDSATVAMKYAADIDRTAYESLLRPSMSPPHLSGGFSGLQNRDHATMIARLQGLRRDLKNDPRTRRSVVPAEVSEAAQNLLSAQSRNRRHHLFVCEKLVPDGSSLLKEYLQASDHHYDTNRTAEGRH